MGKGKPEPGEGATDATDEEDGIALLQLLELVERAARGDQQMGAQLFPALQGKNRASL